MALMNQKFSVCSLQGITDLTHQCIFKNITVLSLDSNLSVFDQK